MMRHKEDLYIPKSLFERPTAAMMKMRRDMRAHERKYRSTSRPTIPTIKLSSHVMKASPEPDHIMDWLMHEEWGLLHALQTYQSIPMNMALLSPGHTPNWDLVADSINNCSRLHRSYKQCKNRYESVIVPREEGKLLYDAVPKKQKKQKTVYKTQSEVKVLSLLD